MKTVLAYNVRQSGKDADSSKQIIFFFLLRDVTNHVSIRTTTYKNHDLKCIDILRHFVIVNLFAQSASCEYKMQPLSLNVSAHVLYIYYQKLVEFNFPRLMLFLRLSSSRSVEEETLFLVKCSSS